VTTVLEIPNAEKTAGKWLRAGQDVRVVHEPPRGDNRTLPWIYLFQINATDSSRSGVEHFITALLQFDCYAGASGGVPEAIELGNSVRAVLKRLQGQTFEGAVVTDVSFAGHRRVPDPDVDEPARQRVILTAELRMHNAPEEGS
jgi:hypothetical protein